jgi:hypothetical protein
MPRSTSQASVNSSSIPGTPISQHNNSPRILTQQHKVLLNNNNNNNKHHLKPLNTIKISQNINLCLRTDNITIFPGEYEYVTRNTSFNKSKLK